MRNLIVAVSFFLIGVGLFAQTSNLVVFTEGKETFTLLLAGERMNRLPVRNLKLTGIPAGVYDVQLVFNNPSLPRVMRKVELSEARELTLALHQDNKAKWGLIFVNEFTLGYLPIAPSGQMMVAFDARGLGNVVGEAPAVIEDPVFSPVEEEVEVPNPGGEVLPLPTPKPMPGYDGKLGCDQPMDDQSFGEAKETIAAKSFSDSKKQLAKQITRSNCLTTSQIVELLILMNFESDKLDFAKFAFAYTYDQDNYYKINEVFSFESSISELEGYLNGIR